MSSVQERLQLKRVPLDEWSIQEQLCLASAVACSGDQNWMSVSRSLKMLCSSNRPSDWFSQKSCAAQYGKLLENVETPKRKKRTISERDNAVVETPSELIVRKLTQERINELQTIILEEQQQYLKFREDVAAVQTADENKLRELWNQIEIEKKQKEKERFHHSQWLKEREERKLEMERAWRPGVFVPVGGAVSISGNSATGTQILPQSSKPPLSLKIKVDDSLDIDEPSSQSSCSTKQGTSPLLTSLLKSPSQAPISTSTTTPIVHTNVTSQQFSSTVARNSAPTITNLLTSNIITTMESSDVKSSISQASTQSGSSTLSMVLDTIEPNSIAQMELASENDTSKDDDQQLMEVFNGLIPDNIDELADILTQNNAIISLSPELLEEGSILGNVDSLIGSHEDLEQVSNVKENVIDKRIEQSVDSKIQLDNVSEDKIKPEWTDEDSLVKELNDNTGDINNKNNIHQEKPHSSDLDVIHTIQNPVETKNSVSQQPSPQSSENDIMIIEDNTPPASEQDATVAYEIHPPLDSKNVESIPDNIKDEKKERNIEIMDDDESKIIIVFDEHDQKVNKDINSETDSKMYKCDVKTEKDTIDIIVKSNQSSIDKSDDDNFEDIKEDIQIIEDSKSIQDNQSISLIDTDDDSPIEVIKEDKTGKQKRDYSRKKSDNQKMDDNNIEELNKGNLNLRMKLKERERSESPFVLDDDNDDIPRARRRYSSTPNIDSIPNSPASSNDDRDYKLWKKSTLIAFNRIQMHKHSSIFQNLDEQYSNYKLILRPIDLISIKKNIETEIIRSTVDFQRDIMLMCYNLLFLNSKMYLSVKEFLQDALNTIDFTFEGTRKDEKLGIVMSGGSTGGSSSSSNLNQASSSSSPLFSTSSSGKGRGGRKSSRMSNV